MIKEIIVLAKSSKGGGFCIAGVDVDNGKWIRPISLNIGNEGSVPLLDITYEDGSEVQIFDKVQIKLLSPKPTTAQPENYVYDASVKWKKTGESSLEEVINFRGYDRTDKVFYNGEKEVSKNEIDGRPSLLLLNIRNSYIFIKTFNDGNRKVQLNFEFNNREYKYFKISDIVIKGELSAEQDGAYRREDTLPAVFSLTDKFAGTEKYYKMVAQLFY